MLWHGAAASRHAARSGARREHGAVHDPELQRLAASPSQAQSWEHNIFFKVFKAGFLGSLGFSIRTIGQSWFPIKFITRSLSSPNFLGKYFPLDFSTIFLEFWLYGNRLIPVVDCLNCMKTSQGDLWICTDTLDQFHVHHLWTCTDTLDQFQVHQVFTKTKNEQICAITKVLNNKANKILLNL